VSSAAWATRRSARKAGRLDQRLQALCERKEPMIHGHEAAGQVNEVGSAVTGLKPGADHGREL
jgi:NADPH:quinone reductase-like Zn-dependent oxidoreductase